MTQKVVEVQTERRTLTVGFADMTGFMRLVDGQSEEAVADLLQRAYEVVGDAVVRRGGRVWKYLGDAVMFSCPEARGAAAAAGEIAQHAFSIGDGTARFHVGVATGEVVMGEFGHASFRNQDIFGHTVHRAAQLCDQAKRLPSQVALDDATRAALN